MKRFHEDLIRRRFSPRDAFELIHDLAYDHEGRDREQYKLRAQEILKRKHAPKELAKIAAKRRRHALSQND